ncbi:hypothetical protein [Acuticoccus mangrovi]|uniref:DNA breaking-rejoining protein n=1 Tax=Acuticoccus mangrovi TaxID=2796142 RepID=A0A934MIC1_9HYPH|nr:hypothetical protein [Acuticoccus mangrovi]MBJ3777775.1 hypothetical protein [Acuticoccus mangrovi]
MKTIAPLALLLALTGAPVAALAQNAAAEQVAFLPGETQTTITGELTGKDTKDYVFKATADQTMSAELTGPSSLYFNVLPPSSQTAIFNGSVDGSTFIGTLPSDGDYTIRLYQMGAAAEDANVADYSLTVSIVGAGEPAASPKPE